MPRIVINTLALLAIALLQGCVAAPPLVLSDIRSPQTVHIITATAKFPASSEPKLLLSGIDGQTTKPGASRWSLTIMPQEAYITPGEHELSVSFVSTMFGSSHADLKLDAQPGHLYVIRYRVNLQERRVAIWITDGQDGPTVGGIAD
jgi:hypothetical protein